MITSVLYKNRVVAEASISGHGVGGGGGNTNATIASNMIRSIFCYDTRHISATITPNT